MDKSEKSELIKSIMPDLVELLSVAIDKLNAKPVKAVKVVKRGRPKATKTTNVSKPKPSKTRVKVSKKPKPKPPRADFDHKKPGFIDDLSLASEFIETDKLVCKKTNVKIDRPKIGKSKCQCGKVFEGDGYLCDKCIIGKKSSAE